MAANRHPAPAHLSVSNLSGGYERLCGAIPVLAFVFAPAGLVLDIIARRQIRRTGEGGRGLALAGVIVAALNLAFSALMLYLFLFGIVMVN